MTNFTDLDLFVDEPKRVRLAGVEYLLPADMPMETHLTIAHLASQEESDGNDMEKESRIIGRMIDTIVSLFQMEYTAADAAAMEDDLRTALGRRGVAFLAQLISRVYSTENIIEGTEAPGPTSGTTKRPSPTKRPARTTRARGRAS